MSVIIDGALIFIAFTLVSVAMTIFFCLMVKFMGPLIDWAMR